MAEAGIDQSDWDIALELVGRESSWNPNAVNQSSGACGLAQSLPCSKIGDNWNDPVVALKWMNSYIQNRYGSWKNAIDFHYANNWY